MSSATTQTQSGGVLGGLMQRLGGPQVAVVHVGGACLALAATLGVGALLLAPRVSAFVRGEKEEVALRDAKAQLAACEKDLVVVAASEAKLREEVGKAVTLRGPEALTDQLQQLAALADEHQVQVRTMLPGQLLTAKDQRSYAIQPIRLGGRASFAQMTSFLRDLGATLRDMRVVGLALEDGAARDDGSWTLAYEVAIAWYTLPPGQSQSGTQSSTPVRAVDATQTPAAPDSVVPQVAASDEGNQQ